MSKMDVVLRKHNLPLQSQQSWIVYKAPKTLLWHVLQDPQFTTSLIIFHMICSFGSNFSANREVHNTIDEGRAVARDIKLGGCKLSIFRLVGVAFGRCFYCHRLD